MQMCGAASPAATRSCGRERLASSSRAAIAQNAAPPNSRASSGPEIKKPLPMIEADLVAGTLVRLAMPDQPGGRYRFSAIHRPDAPPGPAAGWLMKRFVDLGEADDGGQLADV